MRLARGAVCAVLLAWAFSPEIARYRAERVLRVVGEALRVLVTHPSEVPDPALALERIANLALGTVKALPGDPRPWILAGGARLVAAEPDLAISNYRRALSAGERAETDLNLGRAYEALGDFEKSRAAFLRAIWVSPALMSALLPDVAAPLKEELPRLEAELKDGRLKAPPPLP